MNGEGLDATIQLPEQASTLAPMVDSLYYDIYWISVAFFVAIVGLMVYFAWRFRRRRGVTSKPPGHHNALELFWTFSPLILLGYMFHQGFQGFMFMSVPPPNSINVRVTASQWNWSFEYPNGGTDSELKVPIHQPVRLIMSSAGGGRGAVIHSFYVPALRVKRDVVPGMYTSVWFEATRQGTWDIFCTEYCGAPEQDTPPFRENGRPTSSAGHAGMLSRLHVVSRAEWDDYVRGLVTIPPQYNGDYAAWGRDLFTAGGRCTACHVVEPGAPATTGPNLSNVAGYPQPLEDGRTVIADLDYLRNSIREPGADVVRGYPNVMTSFANLHELQIDALVAYIGSLSDRGEEVVQQVQAAHPLEE